MAMPISTMMMTLPHFEMPDPRFYEALGEDGFRAFISNFYDIIVDDATVSHFFPQGGPELLQAKQNSADFFIQVCGGPQWFDMRRGGISMAQAHARFSVTPKAREGWLHCLRQALDELTHIDDELKYSFWDYCDKFSQHVVNVSGEKIKSFEDMASKNG